MSVVKLADMKVGTSGVVEALHRLVDMGVVKGIHITVVKVAPLGDPVEIKVKGTELALRKNEAAMISVAVEGGRQ